MGQVHDGKGETVRGDKGFGPCQGRGFKDQKNPRAGRVPLESAPQWHFRVWLDRKTQIRQVEHTIVDAYSLMESLSYGTDYRRETGDIRECPLDSPGGSGVSSCARILGLRADSGKVQRPNSGISSREVLAFSLCRYPNLAGGPAIGIGEGRYVRGRRLPMWTWCILWVFYA
jgi:hypothetical protein